MRTSAGNKAISNYIRGHDKIFPVTNTQITDSVPAHALQEFAMLAGNQGTMPASVAMLSDASVVEAAYIM